MCFDPAGNMYGTNLDKNSMSKFSNNGTLLAATFGSFNSGPESCLIVGGTTMYVSQVLGTGDIVKLNLSGTQLASYNTRVRTGSISPPISARCSTRTRAPRSTGSMSARTRLWRTSPLLLLTSSLCGSFPMETFWQPQDPAG
jgi:hypothetical protein